MACFGGNSELRQRNLAIERQLRRDNKADKKELKLLLLGTGESGKSTIVKQMRIIYGEGFTEQDRQEFGVLVFRNILYSMKNMLDFMLGNKIELKDKSLEDTSYDILDLDAKKLEFFSEPHQKALLLLWKDAGVKKAYSRRNEFQLSDSTEYYYDELERIFAEGYIPNLQDVLRARLATTGIHEFTFDLDKAIIRMLDVGGQRSERRKWIHCFENITSIIFIVASSEYDQALVEDKSVNRMDESIALFEQIINYSFFRETSFILFLNKQDLLHQKLKTSDLAKHFPAYKGETGDCPAAEEFIKSMYMNKKPPQHDVYPHFTLATDTKNINRVFEGVKSTILRHNLRDYNLY